MNRRQFLPLPLLALSGSFLTGCSSYIHRYSMEIIQLPQLNKRQMMGYLLIAPDKSLIIVDGGKISDAPLLARLIRENGGVVDHWLLTHPHDDHIGALSHIIMEKNDIKIKNVHGSLPPKWWIKKHGRKRYRDFRLLTNALKSAQLTLERTYPGKIISLNGVAIEVLSDINLEITRNAINNSSIVYRVHDFHKSILFLGDLGVKGGQKLLKSNFKEKLSVDYVQMAHHGQRGVDKEFYREVNPSGCFWPTPIWLFQNNAGTGVNSGNWDTLRVRQWMTDIGAKKHYLAATGMHRIF